MLNIVLIGGCLVVLSHLGWIGGFRIDPLDCLVFASLIAAVDPVAVGSRSIPMASTFYSILRRAIDFTAH